MKLLRGESRFPGPALNGENESATENQTVTRGRLAATASNARDNPPDMPTQVQTMIAVIMTISKADIVPQAISP